MLDSFNESTNKCSAIVIYDKQKYSSQLSNQPKNKTSRTECAAIVPYKAEDSLTQNPQDNIQVVDVTEDNNSSIFCLPGESVPDASEDVLHLIKYLIH